VLSKVFVSVWFTTFLFHRLSVPFDFSIDMDGPSLNSEHRRFKKKHLSSYLVLDLLDKLRSNVIIKNKKKVQRALKRRGKWKICCLRALCLVTGGGERCLLRHFMFAERFCT
jgi:hypothetical protein